MTRNHGGTGDLSNLQALGFRCNAGRRDVCLPTQEAASISVACRPAAGCCWRTNWVLCIADGSPVTHGHSLVVPQSHGVGGLVLHQPEWN